MKRFRLLTVIAFLSLLLGVLGLACKKEEGPVAKDPPKKRRIPVEDEPAVDPIDPHRIEQAMKTFVEPDPPPEMAEKPVHPDKDTKANSPKVNAENEEDDEEDVDDEEQTATMTKKPSSPSMKHTH